MKANELMIGDWVWYNNQPHQVRQLGIFGENRDGDNYPAVCVGKPNGVGLMLERNEIEPIPLTQYILEKNGFKPYVPENHLETVYACQDVSKAIADELYALWLCRDGSFYLLLRVNGKDMVRIDVRYVHQLQHALRLCEIEKEIIL